MENKTNLLSEADFNELIQKYEKGKEWLNSMEADTINPMFTKNGNVFDSELYDRGLRRIEQIEGELNSRFPEWNSVDKTKLKSVQCGMLGLSDLNSRETREYFKEQMPGCII